MNSEPRRGSETGSSPEVPAGSLFYHVAVRLARGAKGKPLRAVVLLRGEDRHWQLGSYTELAELQFLSQKALHFLDQGDRDKITKACRQTIGLEAPDFVSTKTDPTPYYKREQKVGTIELQFYLDGSSVRATYPGGHEIAVWSALLGLRFGPSAHPIFRRDRTRIAFACLEATRDNAGIFSCEAPKEGLFE